MAANNQAKPKATELHYWLYSTGNFGSILKFV